MLGRDFDRRHTTLKLEGDLDILKMCLCTHNDVAVGKVIQKLLPELKKYDIVVYNTAARGRAVIKTSTE